MQLSVVIPTCGRDDMLLRAIQSVLVQNVNGIEIVVVQDLPGATMKAELGSLMQRYPIVYVENPGPHGAANARNFGVRVASGEYVTFLDDDDIYMPGRLSGMLELMRTNKYTFVSSGRFYERDDFSEIENVRGQRFGVVTLAAVIKANDIDIGILLKRSTFIELGGFDSSFTNLEDWDFVIRLAELGNGYKRHRFDYCVNTSTGRSRVSSNDWIGHEELSEKYQQKFGRHWQVSMLSRVIRLKPGTRFVDYLKLSIKTRSTIPMVTWAKKQVAALVR